jgi:hypothetical protein
MSSSTFRKYRENAPQVINENWEVVAPVSPELEAEIFKLIQQARSHARSVSQTISIDDEKYHVECKIVGKRNQKGSPAIVQITIDGHRRVTAREVIQKQFLLEHGDCHVTGPNGKIVFIVRDTSHLPTDKTGPINTRSRTAPSPKNCVCKDWGDPHPGRHHYICEWNKLAPPEEQALPEDDSDIEIVDNKVITPVPKVVRSGPAKTIKEETVKKEDPITMPLPAECECQQWFSEGEKKNAHHPLCKWFSQWQQENREASWIIDLATNKKIRKATIEEQAEADLESDKSGFPLIKQGGSTFGVLRESELGTKLA